MKVFIENERDSKIKNLYNEKTFEFKKAVEVSRPYPYPYGFVMKTTSGDNDNLDCFILTDRKLRTGEMVEAEPIGMFEQIEDGREDHKILAVLPGETCEINEDIEQKFRNFISHVFDHIEGKRITVGRFLGKEEAEQLIERCEN